MTDQTTTTDREADRARLLKQAGAITSGASVIGFGVAVYQAYGAPSFVSVFLTILLAVSAFATDGAKLMIRMEEDGEGQAQRIISMIFTKFFFAALAFTAAMIAAKVST